MVETRETQLLYSSSISRLCVGKKVSEITDSSGAYGVGWAVALMRFLGKHFLLAHFVVVAPSLEKTCSSLHCADIVVLRFLRLYSVQIL